MTRETVGIVLELFAVLSLLILITRSLIFGSVGFAISSFLLGVFGYSSYVVLAAWIYGGAVLITGKKFTVSAKTAALFSLCFLFFVCLVHTITADVAGIEYGSFGAYLADCYAAGENSFFATTGGGAVIGVLVYPIAKLTTSIGGYIIFSLLMLGSGYLVYRSVKGHGAEKRRVRARREQAERNMFDRAAADTSGLYDLPYAEERQEGYPEAIVREVSSRQTVSASNAERSRRLYAIGDPFDMKTRRELRQDSRREEEERRAQEQMQPPQPQLSPYAQSRQLLYPEGGSGSSYTSNGIFNADSYFNRPRSAAAGAQPVSGGLNTPPQPVSLSPAAPTVTAPSGMRSFAQSVQAGATYSEMYSDGVEENVSYSSVPKKIVTDTTVQQPAAAFPTERRTEQPSASFRVAAEPARTVSSAEPFPAPQRNPFSPAEMPQVRDLPPRRGVTEERPCAPGPRYGAAAARPADGGAESSSVSFGREERASAIPPAASSDVFGGREERASAIPPAASSDVFGGREEQPPLRGREEPPVLRREEPPVLRREEPPVPAPEQEEGEGTALRRIPEGFDSVVNLFDEEPPEPSSVPDAMESIAPVRGREEAPAPEEVRRPRAEAPARKRHVYARYNAPPLDLLEDYRNTAFTLDPEEAEFNKQTIVETLANFKVPSEIVKVTQGPSVTRYDIVIPGNISASRVFSCDQDLALRLHAKDGVNIQTNYENGSISIEVPNKHRATVGLKEIITADKFKNSKPSALMFALGKDIEGKAIVGDIVKMKHLLVAGATGSGKSIFLHGLIISLLYKYSPEELRLILIDPKQVEFTFYEKLPHLMINEIICDPNKTINVLNWSINEMERRYTLFREKQKQGVPVRDIDDYNEKREPDEDRLPKIVMIIDELADLMTVAKKEIEDRIQRLTQKSRAAGIHLILATQRPSVNVVTGVIKTNLPTRVALKLTAEVDSRTILDESGAEKLLGNGDMLYRTDAMTFPERLQGAFAKPEEMHRVVSYVKEHNEAYFDDSVAEYINNDKSGGGGFGGDADDSVEAVYIEALRYVVEIGQASISMIQRRCSVGYPKAGKIIEWMENMGYISAFDGSKARKVLLSKEEFESKYGDYGD